MSRLAIEATVAGALSIVALGLGAGSLPVALRDLVTTSAATTQRATATEAGSFFLLAVDSPMRTDTSAAPGAIIVGSEAGAGEDRGQFR